MASPNQAPPRPIAPGDVVAAYSRMLGEWAAAQIIQLDPTHQKAAVLELDWSGPEPSSVADLGEVAPLRLTHHSWNGSLSYCNYEWVLPRSYKLLGALPLRHHEPSNSWSTGWRLGDQLAYQRRWDTGGRDDMVWPWQAEYTGADLNRLLDEPAAPRPDIGDLTVRAIESLDCDRLVSTFPALTDLMLAGDLGLLTSAASLNRLESLRRLYLVDLFGMTKQDRLLPQHVPQLEALILNGVPAEYAAAMRPTWRPEIPHGTFVDIRKARKLEWVAENRNNPLRDWDGRDHISTARYRKAVTQFKATRRAILAVLSDQTGDDQAARLVEIGRGYGQAFDQLDRRTWFIETVERDELFNALDQIVAEAEAGLGHDLTWARDSLTSGVEEVRDW